MGFYKEYRKYYAVKGLEVSEGGCVRRWYDSKERYFTTNSPNYLSRQTDKNGNQYVLTRDYGRIYVDEIVATCWCHRPSGCNLILHKDGNKSNCHKNNLKWVGPYEFGESLPNDPLVNTPDGFRLVFENTYVSKKGEVKQDGVLLKPKDWIYDPDLDSHRVVMPYVDININGRSRRVKVCEMVVTAFLPKPDSLSSPVLLYKDFDYRNYSLDNLEWVEKSDERYLMYQQKSTDDWKQRNEELKQQKF